MISEAEAVELIRAIRTSGRLREADHAVIARALLILIDRRAEFPADPVEALVQAIASLVVADERKRSAQMYDPPIGGRQ